MSHRRLVGLVPDEMAEEIERSGDLLATRLGVSVEWFAYPFGDIDSVDAAALAVIGRRFAFCRSGVRGANGPGTHRLALRAESLDPGVPAAYRRLILEGGLDWRYRAARKRLDALAEVASNAQA